MRDIGIALIIIPFAAIASGFFTGLIETICSGDIKDDIAELKRRHRHDRT